jgi:hypothetical protein
MLKTINLSLSSACGANCLFCPSARGTRIKQKTMSLALVKKIADEVASPEFSLKHQIEHFSLGENGDAFLNKDIIEILRYLKFKFPGVKKVLFTNFQNFSKDKAEIILNEELINGFCCNIDGSCIENYFLVKGINLGCVERNLLDFLDLRKKIKNKPSLVIFVLTLNRYIKTIKSNFGFYPSRLKDLKALDIPDDFVRIKNQWRGLLDSEKDAIDRQYIHGWAERERMSTQPINYKKYSCFYLERLKEGIFIAPDGTSYFCCLDANNELVLGNANLESIDQIYSGQTRRNLIEMLEKKEFAKIGGPCKTVNCCQALLVYPKLKKTIKRLTPRNLISHLNALCRKNPCLYNLSTKFRDLIWDSKG